MNLDKFLKQIAIPVLGLISVILSFIIAGFFADIIRLILLSVFTTYLLYPLLKILEKIIKNRIYSIILIYVGIAIVVTLGVLLVVPEVISQFMTLSDNLQNHIPVMLNWLRDAVTPLAAKIHYNITNTSFNDFYNIISANLLKLDPQSFINQITNMAGSTIIFLTNFFMVLIFTFYFLLDSDKIDKEILKHVPLGQQAKFGQMLVAINSTLNQFFQGQIVLALIFSLIILILLLILGVHYPLALTAFLAFWEIVPVVGPPIGFVPIFVSVSLKGMDNLGFNRLSQILVIFILFNVFQWVKDNIVAPKYVGNKIGLHPILIIISILIGAKLDGLTGIIISLPIACIIHEFIHYLKASLYPNPINPNQ